MIYIKNYRKVNLKTSFNEPNEFTTTFLKLIGKPITVFTDSGGVSGRGFTGLLLKVSNNSIELLLNAQSKPIVKNNCMCSSCRKKESRSVFGTKIKIYINHIIAVTYNYI